MPLAATQMNLDITILSEVSQRQVSYDTTYMLNLKNDTKKLTYKTETNSQIQKAILWLPKGVMKEQER